MRLKYNRDVKELTIFDFKGDQLKSNEDLPGIVVFYAPWCKHCRDRVPLWNELATHFKKRIIVAVVNCEDRYNQSLRWKLNIKKYPTVKYFKKDGILKPYLGDIDKNSLYNFVSDLL